MKQVLDDILTVDWGQVQLRQALSGLVTMLVVVGFLGFIDDVVLAALMAALFVSSIGGAGSMSERLPAMVSFTVIGGLAGGLAYWSTGNVWLVAVVLGVAAYLGTLAAAFGPVAAKSGMYLSIWPLFALMLGSGDTEPWRVVVAFLAGGALAIVITALRLRVTRPDAGNSEEEAEQGKAVARPVTFDNVLAATTEPIGLFALLRTVAIVLAVVVGAWWFDSYPLWVAITVIVIVKPSSSQSVSVAVQRTLGTAIGVAVAVVVAQVLPKSDTAVAIAFVVCGFLMIAFNNANYTLFATFLTAMLVFGQRLAHADAFEAGWERLLATLVGAVIALAVMAVAMARWPSGTDNTGETA